MRGKISNPLFLNKSNLKCRRPSFFLSFSLDRGQSECVRTVNMIRALYSHCAQGEEGSYLGCVTERIGRSGKITLPVYANMCSAMCYEADQQGETRVHRCPYEGTRQHDPNLQRLF